MFSCSLAAAVATVSDAFSTVSAYPRVWLTAPATWPSTETTTLAPSAAFATLRKISPVAAFCSCREPATVDVNRSISCKRSALR